MRTRNIFLDACLLPVFVLVVAGCHSHPLTDFRPLDKAGMDSPSVQQLKALNVTDAEIAQVIKMKQGNVSDDTCIAVVSAAHSHGHSFTSADSVTNMQGARFAETQIVQIANTDKLEIISGDAVTLRLIGLSDPTVEMLVQKHLDGAPVMSSGEIARLKNTGLTEKQIVEHINEGMTDEQAEHEVYVRETIRNHSNTGFVRTRGRRR